MKKAKILAVFGILLAMGITACNNGGESDVQSQETPATSEQQGGGASSEHKHKYGEWTQTKAPTCTEKGSKERVCECGEKDVQEIPALGHDFENGTEVPNSDTSTCTADGIKKIKCSRCEVTKDVEVKAHHKFGQRTKVDKGSGADEIDYYTALCSVDNALELSFPTEVGGKYQGTSRKSGTPEGYTKLSGSGSISWTINLAGTKGYIGKMYHMACMDAFSSNSEKNYKYYDSRSSNTRDEGNFKFYVNGIEADKSAYMNISFDDLTKNGEVDPNLAAITESPGPYSPVALCPLGDNVYIGPGTNVFKYERSGSYNMVMRELVFIGTEYTHTHNNSAEFTGKDENQHWKVCTAPGCPINGKVDAANHTFVEVDTETDPAHKAKAATCSEEGIKVEVCSVCNYRKESAISKIAHTFPADGGWTQNKAATCTEAGERQHTCSVCSEVVKEAIPALGHNFGDAVENYAAVTEGENQHIAETAHNCSRCDVSSLRWKATDYDVTKTTDRSTAVPESRASGKAIRWSSTPNYDGKDTTKKGCHVVYNINVPVAVENAGLSFKTSKRDDVATIFDMVEGDNSKGYEYVNEELVRPDSRYGLKIDGNVVLVNKDTSGQTWQSDIAWYRWPVSLNLTAGVHEIEIYNLGGYRVDMYEFELTGLPHVTPSHVHNGGDAWASDNDNHWHICTAEGCPIADGIYDKEAHDFDEMVVVTPATCTANGAGTKECKVCHKVVDVVIPALGHDISAGTAVKNSDNKDVAPITCSRGDVEGYEMALADYSGADDTADAIASDGKLAKEAVMTWKFKLTADGEGHYKAGKIAFMMYAKLNGGTTGWGSSAKPADTTFADGSDAKVGSYTLTGGAKAGVITAAGKKLGADFGATVDDSVFFEMGTIEFEESDLVNGELVVKLVQPKNQGYRPRFSGNVRIMYVA